MCGAAFPSGLTPRDCGTRPLRALMRWGIIHRNTRGGIDSYGGSGPGPA
jgi:hypothetical protein